DGRRHLILDRPIAVDCPVRILQGDNDPDVPPAHAMRVFNALSGSDVTLAIVKGGDHRLSRPQDIALLKATVRELAERHGCAARSVPREMSDSANDSQALP